MDAGGVLGIWMGCIVGIGGTIAGVLAGSGSGSRGQMMRNGNLMKIGIVTPYYGETEDTLKRCMDSVVDQNTEHECIHYLIADGVYKEWVKKREGRYLVNVLLPHFGDYGNTPRCFGAALAQRDGCDAICFLDADCWIEPDHVDVLSSSMNRDVADVVICSRNLFRVDGSFLALDVESEGNLFVDTNCYMIGKKAYPLLASWLFHPDKIRVVADRVVWKCLSENEKLGHIKISRVDKATVNYQTTIASHYLRNNETPPALAKEILMTEEGGVLMNYDEFYSLDQTLKKYGLRVA